MFQSSKSRGLGENQTTSKKDKVRQSDDHLTQRRVDTKNVSDTESLRFRRGVVKNVELHNGSFSRKNKKGVRYGVKLKDALHHMDKKTGGKLNPNFVEFLMGFPMNWTKVESEGSKD